MDNKIHLAPKAGEKSEHKEHKSAQQTALWIGSVIVLVLAAVTFVFIPSMGVSAGFGDSAPYGSFNRQAIEDRPGTLFSRVVNNQENMYKQYYQGELPDSMIQRIYQEAFEETVRAFAFSQAVTASSYLVPEQLVDRTMLPYFSVDGVFSPQAFQKTPDSQKLAMKKQLTEWLIQQRYSDDFFGASFGDSTVFKGLSDAEAAFFQKMSRIERSFDLAAFDIASFPVSAAASFATEQRELFVKYDLSIVSASDKNAAASLLKRIKNNEILFDDAVTESSANYYSTDGKVTSSYYHQLKNIIDNAEELASVTALAADELSGVVKTGIGYSIFRANSAPVQPDISDNAVLESIRSYMMSYEKTKVEDYFTNIAKDFSTAAGRNGFDAACAEFNTTKIDVPAFPLNFGNNPVLTLVPTSSVSAFVNSSDPSQNAENNENFLKTAFSLRPNEISSPLILGNSVLVLQLKAETIKSVESADADTAASLSNFTDKFSSFDQSALNRALMQDKRLKNNFLSVFAANLAKRQRASSES